MFILLRIEMGIVGIEIVQDVGLQYRLPLSLSFPVPPDLSYEFVPGKNLCRRQIFLCWFLKKENLKAFHNRQYFLVLGQNQIFFNVLAVTNSLQLDEHSDILHLLQLVCWKFFSEEERRRSLLKGPSRRSGLIWRFNIEELCKKKIYFSMFSVSSSRNYPHKDCFLIL